MTDVIMIAMTAAILVSIDPLLALVTLAPLPFIVWMIHVVRDKSVLGLKRLIVFFWSEVTNILADTIPSIRSEPLLKKIASSSALSILIDTTYKSMIASIAYGDYFLQQSHF